ncbi:[Fe-Fe] hydrogenase large subunit C-terminal domain-containing protein [Candidatus Soleaferrea massiliensis]|uniref:[Fe-Fe] hydrogenase large subunit C-terminal domain-containing protein n=1 Tax=Candidatus Soleaferrea massiliensis TaxID=1470354 RepID=UPI000590391D|nr:[Fe-Fe] hydrogenase large subunit C-terminal domain-containing protein [Candidatus Soleaferrea massiliensis]
MPSFNELYGRLVKATAQDASEEELKKIRKEDFDPHQLECLLNPEKYPLVWRVGNCNCSDDDKTSCLGRCLFDALEIDENGNVAVFDDKCVGCSECIDNCKSKKLVASKDVLPVLRELKKAESPIFAIIAPAFISQFSTQVTPGMLRSAFKALGFTGMVEVALFADVLTLKEALEFDATIQTDQDFLLTSCCCPMWIGMIRRVYHQLVPHVPGSVSPMVACGRTIKHLEKDAKVVFIGPCIAKKAEAREKDVADAVDYVLTFQEIQDVFDFTGIDPAKMEEDDRDHSSRAGRIYARTGGVSEAVKNTVRRLNPDRKIKVHARQANGVPACKEMLNDLKEGKNTSNFLEGMGCVGGCVGGPRVLIDRQVGAEHVDVYGDEAAYPTPLDNPYVIELLHRLGFETVESLLKESDIFTRRFD